MKNPIYLNILKNGLRKDVYINYIMPYNIRKVRNKECYEVRNIETGRVASKCTTRDKAIAQVRLLTAQEASFKPKKRW